VRFSRRHNETCRFPGTHTLHNTYACTNTHAYIYVLVHRIGFYIRARKAFARHVNAKTYSPRSTRISEKSISSRTVSRPQNTFIYMYTNIKSYRAYRISTRNCCFSMPFYTHFILFFYPVTVRCSENRTDFLRRCRGKRREKIQYKQCVSPNNHRRRHTVERFIVLAEKRRRRFNVTRLRH
jgi:hypothetical protein